MDMSVRQRTAIAGGSGGELHLDQLNRWLTPLANIALLAGLVLVAYERNQNRSLARMELVNEGNVVQNQIWANLMGEIPGEVIARARTSGGGTQFLPKRVRESRRRPDLQRKRQLRLLAEGQIEPLGSREFCDATDRLQGQPAPAAVVELRPTAAIDRRLGVP
jgi:hypothetical protein